VSCTWCGSKTHRTDHRLRRTPYGGFHDEIRERLTTQRERFDKARDDFVAAAHTTAGAHLGD